MGENETMVMLSSELHYRAKYHQAQVVMGILDCSRSETVVSAPNLSQSVYCNLTTPVIHRHLRGLQKQGYLNRLSIELMINRRDNSFEPTTLFYRWFIDPANVDRLLKMTEDSLRRRFKDENTITSELALVIAIMMVGLRGNLQNDT